jgi:hypothetical protein
VQRGVRVLERGVRDPRARDVTLVVVVRVSRVQDDDAGIGVMRDELLR